MIVNKDRSERVQYDKAELPIYLRKGVLSRYPNFTAESHWHDELEFISVIKGRMRYRVNEEVVTIEEGEGIFVNSRRFHYGFSKEREECEFLCVLLHPVLLCASRYVEERYVSPLLGKSARDFCVLKREEERGEKILNCVAEMFDASEPKVIALFYEILDGLRGSVTEGKKDLAANSKLNVLKNMISYIQSSYREKTGLADIARAGAVEKTECCKIFRDATNLTPISYLNDYRLRKAAELLINTDMRITEICFETGFSGASYFSEIFKRTFRVTPKEYREASRSDR